MTEEEKKLQQQNSETAKTTEGDNNQYIEALKEMKENTVDRAKYDQLKAENKKLLESIVNGQEIDLPATNNKTNDELRKSLFSRDGHLENVEFVRNLLELRSNLISEGEPDPFLPYGSQVTPDDKDIAAAEKVATVLQECLDYADEFGGDNMVFTNELQRRMIDSK